MNPNERDRLASKEFNRQWANKQPRWNGWTIGLLLILALIVLELAQ